MNKSTRTSAPGSNSGRRYSQPVFSGPQSSDKGRRISEAVPNARSGSEPPPPSSLQAHHEETLTGEKDRARRPRAGKDISDGPSFDPDHYNPDGTLRTIHRLPNFGEAYAEASKARYVRHRDLLEREKELTVKQIFEDS